MERGHLEKKNLGPFLETLRRFGELHGPTLNEAGVSAFAPLVDLSSLRLEYRRTQIPPKKYLLRFREELLHYTGGAYRPGQASAKNVVLFAVHPCDLEGIAYLDQVFLGERPDPLYQQRRSRLTLIGISCEPDDFCFCTGACESAACDLFLSEDEDGFQITTSTGKGKEIAAAALGLLTESRPVTRSPAPFAPVRTQDPQLRFSDNPLWQDFADRCVSCGACSVCCPTCYCFDVRENPTLTGDARRIREWDNCLFVTHGEVNGTNFRPTRLDRLRYRFLHKYCGFSPLEGMTSCVGCGRCRKVCPVDIDLRELFPTEDLERHEHS